MIIPRNPIYRPRNVRLELYVAKTEKPELGFDLTEVNSIEFTSTSATTVTGGAVAAIVQPWYFGPIMVNITARSYIGAFGPDTAGGFIPGFRLEGPDIALDKDIVNVIEIRRIVNQQFLSSFKSIRDLRFKLIYEDPNDKGNLAVSQTLIGMVMETFVNEGEIDPFMKAYRLKFVGEEERILSLLRGAETAKADQKQADKKTTTKINTNAGDAAKESIEQETADLEESSKPSTAAEVIVDDNGGEYRETKEVRRTPTDIKVTRVIEVDADGTRRPTRGVTIERSEPLPPGPTMMQNQPLMSTTPTRDEQLQSGGPAFQ